ncbi:MAG: N-acetyltransferase family protein [Pseudomonadota bacterium]
MIIRPATHADAGAIAEIWNHYIRDTTVTFTTDEKTADDVTAYIDARQTDGMSVVVAQTAAGLMGFAAASSFRSGPGYARTLESSVMLRDGASGAGMGRALMQAVEDAARRGGATALVAGISGENDAAMAFHARLGFADVGRMPGVGQKFGRALDLVLMQKTL